MFGFFSNFYKTEMYVKEPCQVYMCTKFYVDILKIAEFWCFKGKKRHFSRCFLRFLHFPDFQNLPDLGYSKSVLGPFFAFLTKK